MYDLIEIFGHDSRACWPGTRNISVACHKGNEWNASMKIDLFIKWYRHAP